MSSNWTARFLLPIGELAAGRASSALEAARRFGFAVERQGEGAVAAMMEDGTGSILFSSYEAGWAHIQHSGGLIALMAGEEEVGLSVHRANGALEAEMQVFGERPIYDEVRITASLREIGGRGLAWRFLNHGLLDVAVAMRAQFAWGATDEFIEELVPVAVHVAAQNGSSLPALFPWSVAREDSGIAEQMLGLCRRGLGTCRRVGSFVEHRLGDDVAALGAGP